MKHIHVCVVCVCVCVCVCVRVYDISANPLARLRKAMALSHVDRNLEALEELVALQHLAPRESTVYVQV
jgi:hypothetical protein